MAAWDRWTVDLELKAALKENLSNDADKFGKIRFQKPWKYEKKPSNWSTNPYLT